MRTHKIDFLAKIIVTLSLMSTSGVPSLNLQRIKNSVCVCVCVCE